MFVAIVVADCHLYIVQIGSAEIRSFPRTIITNLDNRNSAVYIYVLILYQMQFSMNVLFLRFHFIVFSLKSESF